MVYTPFWVVALLHKCKKMEKTDNLNSVLLLENIQDLSSNCIHQIVDVVGIIGHTVGSVCR